MILGRRLASILDLGSPLVGLSFHSISNKNKLNSNKLSGNKFVVSGVFTDFTREKLKQLIVSNGGEVTSSISNKTSYILGGENIGPAKLIRAESLNISIISESQFIKMIK